MSDEERNVLAFRLLIWFAVAALLLSLLLEITGLGDIGVRLGLLLAAVVFGVMNHVLKRVYGPDGMKRG